MFEGHCYSPAARKDSAASQGIDRAALKDWLIELLERRPNHSIALKHIPAEYARDSGLHPFRGARKKEFLREIGCATASLLRERWPKIRPRYNGGANERVRLSDQYIELLMSRQRAEPRVQLIICAR